MQTLTILGATGLIGGHILDYLLMDGTIESVRILVRRPVEIHHPKLEVKVLDFTDLRAFEEGIRGSEAVFCAVGTTKAKVKGDKTAYRKVDFDIPVNAARFCAEMGVPKFLLVSSVGANSHSGNFYLKLKGEVEDALQTFRIPSVTIFRPSMLLGKRNESRPMESLAQAVSKPLSFLFPSKYKPVRAEDVAQAMVAAAKKAQQGFHVLHHREIYQLINTSRT